MFLFVRPVLTLGRILGRYDEATSNERSSEYDHNTSVFSPPNQTNSKYPACTTYVRPIYQGGLLDEGNRSLGNVQLIITRERN